jgi:hypothetical protein
MMETRVKGVLGDSAKRGGRRLRPREGYKVGFDPTKD